MLAEIRTRLIATCMPPLRLVAGGAQLAALKAPPPTHLQPAAYVIPLADTAGDNAIATGIRQRVTHGIGVVLVLGNLSDARGQAPADAIEDTIAAVRAELVGFVPIPAADPLLLRGGELTDTAEGALMWLESYATQTTLRAT